MARRGFTNCLNTEPKVWNTSIGGIIGGVAMLALIGLSKGLMWGAGACAIGFMTGKWFSSQWFLGFIQRRLYWHLPGSKLLINSKIPSSHHRRLI